MRGARTVLVLGLMFGGVGTARAEETLVAATAGVALPESVRPQVEAALVLRARGWPEVATTRLAQAYDRLAVSPRRYLVVLHAIASDTVNTAALAYRVGEDPGPMCVAFDVLDRHIARVRALGRSTPAFEEMVGGVRTDLAARLGARGDGCPGRSAPRGPAGRGDMLLGPGRLAQAVADRPPAPPRRRRALLAARFGLVMMGTGLMMLGGGLGVGAAERIERRDLLQASMFIGGTGLFVGGLPLLVIGEQKVRATLAASPGGLVIRF